ncbi:DUF5687 family protein [Mesonia sp. K7]|uniref:DUF5687 family protein n=1 Tax=Mesonia sp. K7 TaxID=2218606 RepID=UPI000DAA2C5F|nr:DUF5687 family protein [Mesonia sp. K7]PZD79089.1 hypothetical protein DNG35_03530 [Mesonia sp. K7]
MVRKLLSLEWKQFKRSPNFQKGLAIKIILILAVVYFAVSFLFLGVGAFFIIEDAFPDQDPITVVNNYLIYWFLFDMFYRFFMQQMPVLNVKPFMVLPIKREKLIHFVLGKTAFSVFNFLPQFFFLPFSIVLLFQGYSPLLVIGWYLAMLFFTLCVNFLNFLINKNNTFFYIIATLLLGGIALQIYQIVDFTVYGGMFFNKIYEIGYGFLIPLLALILLYRINYTIIRKGFYLDEEIRKKTKAVSSQDMSFLNRFGDVAPFLKNDIKLIIRNARPKQVLLMSFLFLFYGLIFFTQDIYRDMPAVLVFASVFVTGGFLMTFGQLVPSWDSEYYKMMMSQNIPYRLYLKSKWILMIVGCLVSLVLSIPYLYFGMDIFLMIAAGAAFNVGLNSFITLLGGVLNRVPVKLNEKAKAFSNTQGFNPTQLIIAIPKMVGPMLIFYIPYKFINFEAGIFALALSGIIGLVFYKPILNKIEEVYQKTKYKTIAAYDEKN